MMSAAGVSGVDVNKTKGAFLSGSTAHASTPDTPAALCPTHFLVEACSRECRDRRKLDAIDVELQAYFRSPDYYLFVRRARQARLDA